MNRTANPPSNSCGERRIVWTLLPPMVNRVVRPSRERAGCTGHERDGRRNFPLELMSRDGNLRLEGERRERQIFPNFSTAVDAQIQEPRYFTEVGRTRLVLPRAPRVN